MVIKYTGEDHFKSTYSSFYAKGPTRYQRPISLRHQPTQLLLPVIQHGDKQLVECRTHADYIDRKKYARPIGLTHDNPICLGLGSFTDAPVENAHKEIVSCPRPQDKKFKRGKKKCSNSSGNYVVEAKDALRQGEHLDDMIVRLRWIPSTSRQQEEECLTVPNWKVPRTTMEKNADVVRNRPKRYESSVGAWQTVASSWDRLQMRQPISRSTCCKDNKVSKNQQNQLEVEKAITQGIENYRTNSSYVIADQSRVRKLPGYGGFVPREPVERIKYPQRQGVFQTSSSSTYHNFPGYTVPGLHSKGPLSRMVTLVYPCNPFKLTPSTMQTRINPLY
ncbi:uncharacterized protein LOC120329788 [Styela clava]